MRKKIMMMAAALMFSVASFAQFEEGKFYANASLSGFDLHYNKGEKWNMELGSKVGYMAADCLMLLANVDYAYHQNDFNTLSLGVGGRYYIVQNGLYLGAGANYVHRNGGYNDFMPNAQVGYAFFLNDKITLEPELYYKQSFKNHDFSGVGFRLSVGIYIDELFDFR